ncbi:MAG TPA: alpha/beta hydrolase [Candidatus Cybelea sp.]|nr:alpha/beta hydrolase [Candidatus Cybelea sp.]
MSTALEVEIERGRSRQQWVVRIFWFFIALLVLLCVAGAVYEAASERRDRQRFPQVGRSIDVGGFTLNLDCRGSGKPTVILESGLGIPAIGWQFVQPEIAKFARVCSYDRAGYGWSEAGPLPRTSREIALELHTLLRHAQITPPYILVGHSFGGFNIRLFNQLYPGEAAGFVFVDSSQEDQETMMSRAMLEANAKDLRELRRMSSVMGLLIDLGIARMGLSRTLGGQPVPPDLREELIYLELDRKYSEAILSEEASFDDSAEEARGAGTLGDKPVIVLTAGAGGEVPGVPKQDADDFFAAWVGELQPRIAHLSTRSRQIVLLKSHHLIPFEQPGAIVDAVRNVANETRRQALPSRRRSP